MNIQVGHSIFGHDDVSIFGHDDVLEVPEVIFLCLPLVPIRSIPQKYSIRPLKRICQTIL